MIFGVRIDEVRMMTGEVKNLPRDVGSDIRPKIQAKRIPSHLAEHPSQETAVAPGASGRNRRLCVVWIVERPFF